MLYFLAFTPEPKPLKRRFCCVWESITGQCRGFKKSSDESNGHYEGLATRKSHFNLSDKKRNPKFVDEIQASNDNDPFKSIRLRARVGVSKFLISKVMHEDFKPYKCVQIICIKLVNSISYNCVGF